MSGLEKMVIANIALDIFSIVLSLIPMLYLLDSGRYKEELRRYFLGIAISNILMIIGDLSDWLIPHPTGIGMKVLLHVLTVLYYTASAFILYFFSRYIAAYMQLSDRVKKRCLGAVSIVCAIDILFALTSPFTGYIFYVTDDGYHRGPLFIISQLIPLFCYILFTALVMIYNKRLKRREIIFFLLYIFVPLVSNMTQMFLQGIAVVNSAVSIAILLILVNIQFEHELAMRRMEKELAEQRIDILLTQIQPHFLYNTLGTIAYLCRNDPATAEKVTMEFSLFLRGNIDSLKNRGLIPFEKELEHVKNYLYLEQQRFQDRLTVIYDIQTTDFFVPPLSLQPLVENAVRHGILRKRNGGKVTLQTRKTENGSVVRIADDGIGMERAKTLPNLGDHEHIGIENVRTRIRTMVNGTMEIDSDNNQHTIYRRKMMRFLAVDDEKIMLDQLEDMLRRIRPEAEIVSCTWPDDALEAAGGKRVDVAFLDIEIGGMTGLELAARLKKVQPDIHIVFVTGYQEYALDAFAIHATGYLLKPVSEEALERELGFIYQKTERTSRVRIQTFGGFEIYVDGQPVKFARTKSKELLAFLIDRRGASVTTREACVALFEDDSGTRMGYFRNILRELKNALRNAGVQEILERSFNSLAIVPEKIDCDYYRFLDGDPAAVNQYQNDYMPSYSWAEPHNATLGFVSGKNQ